jgi:hypothetical protein
LEENMKRLAVSLALSLAITFPALPQTAQSPLPTPDVAAAQAVSQSAAALGSLPTDLTATGSVHVVAGSLVEDGTIQILARGTSQSAENCSTPSAQRQALYSNGRLVLVEGSIASKASYERAAVGHAADFPLQLLANALTSPDYSFQTVGVDQVSGRAALHIRFWNTYNSIPGLQPVAPFSLQDLWIDQTSHFPLQLAYVERVAGGYAPSIPMEVTYSGYQNVSGVMFPFSIQKSRDGTPWQTITIQRVSLNNGLTDANFTAQ